MSNILKRFDNLLQQFWTQPSVTTILNKMQSASDLCEKALQEVEDALKIARNVVPLQSVDDEPDHSCDGPYGESNVDLTEPCFAYDVAEMLFITSLNQSLEELRLELQSICDEYGIKAIKV